jgi:hypothetical protein
VTSRNPDSRGRHTVADTPLEKPVGAVTGTMVFPMSEELSPDSKVLIRTVKDDEENTETLWATSLGNDLYRLDNSPFFAYDVSWEDIVLAPPEAEHQYPTFQRVVEKSGNRTIRVIFEEALTEGSVAGRINQALNGLGVTYEGANCRYLCYNIPPNVNLDQVTSILNGQPLEWEYADPSYDTLIPPSTIGLKEVKTQKSWLKRFFKM